MKVGDLIKFKKDKFHELYGVGLLLGNHSTPEDNYRFPALFNGERVWVLLREIEVIGSQSLLREIEVFQ